MVEFSGDDYHALDRLGISKFLFFPRSISGISSAPAVSGVNATAEEVLIPVDDDLVVGATYYTAQKTWPNVLLFHGNGEIVADFGEMASLFLQAGLNFLAVDYRGYGRSTGVPSVSGLMQDSHAVFAYTQNWLSDRGFSGPIIVMGRTLGCVCVLELIAAYGDRIDGAIIESGFALTRTPLEYYGVNTEALGLTEDRGFRNIDKMKTFAKPTLIIHGEFNHMLPMSECLLLYHACPAPDKMLLKIPRADHNDTFCMGRDVYMGSVKELAAKVVALR